MGIEERIEELEKLTEELSDKIIYLEKINNDKWVSAKELAELMGCSTNNVYVKIRSGEIYATKKLGAIPRIPMSQFYMNASSNDSTIDKQKPSGNLSIKEKVFGFM